jgi:hypothetical protein
MSLSRKHFEAIAREIKTLMGTDLRWTNEPFSDFIDSLCYNFRQDNPNFDRDKFIEACGFEDGLYPEEKDDSNLGEDKFYHIY